MSAAANSNGAATPADAAEAAKIAAAAREEAHLEELLRAARPSPPGNYEAAARDADREMNAEASPATPSAAPTGAGAALPPAAPASLGGRSGAGSEAPAPEIEAKLCEPIMSPHLLATYRVLDRVVERPPRVGAYLEKLFGLNGEVAIVTGAARGIGLALARGLAQAGARVCMADVNGDAVARESELLNRELGEEASMALSVDMTHRPSIVQMFAATLERFGLVSICVNNAGLAISGEDIRRNYSESFSEDDFNKTIDLNLKAVFVCCQFAAKWMIANSVRGSIINIASMSAGVVNWPQRQSVYNASKAAVVQLSKCLAVEWANYGIRVNCISPGYIDTPLNRQPSIAHLREEWQAKTPQKRLGDCKDLVGAVILLASNTASAFTTGSDIIIDGGYTLW